MKKLKTRFKVVGLEEVFKTAIEVNGTPILENPTELRQWKSQSERDGESLEKSEGLQQLKRE